LPTTRETVQYRPRQVQREFSFDDTTSITTVSLAPGSSSGDSRCAPARQQPTPYISDFFLLLTLRFRYEAPTIYVITFLIEGLTEKPHSSLGLPALMHSHPGAGMCSAFTARATLAQRGERHEKIE